MNQPIAKWKQSTSIFYFEFDFDPPGQAGPGHPPGQACPGHPPGQAGPGPPPGQAGPGHPPIKVTILNFLIQIFRTVKWVSSESQIRPRFCGTVEHRRLSPSVKLLLGQNKHKAHTKGFTLAKAPKKIKKKTFPRPSDCRDDLSS